MLNHDQVPAAAPRGHSITSCCAQPDAAGSERAGARHLSACALVSPGSERHRARALLPVAPSSSRLRTDVVNVSSLSHGSKGAPKVFWMELAPGDGSRPQAAARNWSKAVKLTSGHGFLPPAWRVNSAWPCARGPGEQRHAAAFQPHWLESYLIPIQHGRGTPQTMARARLRGVSPYRLLMVGHAMRGAAAISGASRCATGTAAQAAKS